MQILREKITLGKIKMGKLHMKFSPVTDFIISMCNTNRTTLQLI